MTESQKYLGRTVFAFLLFWGIAAAMQGQAGADWVAPLDTATVAATMVVIWWTAYETARLRALTRAAAESAARPFVVIRQERRKRPRGARYYVVQNVGPGAAAASYYVGDDDKVAVLSPLAPGQSHVVPDAVGNALERDARATLTAKKHFVLAEGLDGRWWRSANVVEASNGNVASIVVEELPSAALRAVLAEKVTTFGGRYATDPDAFDEDFARRHGIDRGTP